MGKLADKRRKRREDKRRSKFGVNPTTGKVLTRKEHRRAMKYGYNEDGTINSKRQEKFQRKQQRVDIKKMRQEGRNLAKENRTAGRRAKKEGKGDKLRSQGVATEVLAEQGIDVQSDSKRAIMDGIGNSIGGVADAIGNIYGGGVKQMGEGEIPFEEMSLKNANAENTEAKKNNSIFLWIGLGVLTLIGGAVMLFRGKKKKRR